MDTGRVAQHEVTDEAGAGTAPGERTAYQPEVAPDGSPATRWVSWTLLVSGVVGLVASGALMLDLLRVLENPDYIPSCSWNPVLSCGSVMTTWQASVFGLANPVLGIVGFAALTTVGVLLVAGTVLRDGLWWGMLAGTVGGMVFVHWLIWESLFTLGALCPYCMVVWVVTVAAFLAVLSHLSLRGRLPWWVREYAGLALPAWAIVLGIAILVRFWDYWSSVL